MYNHQIGNHVQLMILDLTYILHFKVTCDNEGQTYTNHALSPTNLTIYHGRMFVSFLVPTIMKQGDIIGCSEHYNRFR